MSITRNQVDCLLKRLETNKIIWAIQNNVALKYPQTVLFTATNLVDLSSCKYVVMDYDIIASTLGQGKKLFALNKEGTNQVCIDAIVVTANNKVIFRTVHGLHYDFNTLCDQFPYVLHCDGYTIECFNNLINTLNIYNPDVHKLMCDEEEVTNLNQLNITRIYTLLPKNKYRPFTVNELLIKTFYCQELIYKDTVVEFIGVMRRSFEMNFTLLLKDKICGNYIHCLIGSSFHDIKFNDGTPFGVKVD